MSSQDLLSEIFNRVDDLNVESDSEIIEPDTSNLLPVPTSSQTKVILRVPKDKLKHLLVKSQVLFTRQLCCLTILLIYFTNCQVIENAEDTTQIATVVGEDKPLSKNNLEFCLT